MNLVMAGAKHCKRLCNLMLWACDGITNVMYRLVQDPTFCPHLKSLEFMPNEIRDRYPGYQLCRALRRLRPLLEVTCPREADSISSIEDPFNRRYGGLPAYSRIQSEAEEIMRQLISELVS